MYEWALRQALRPFRNVSKHPKPRRVRRRTFPVKWATMSQLGQWLVTTARDALRCCGSQPTTAVDIYPQRLASYYERLHHQPPSRAEQPLSPARSRGCMEQASIHQPWGRRIPVMQPLVCLQSVQVSAVRIPGRGEGGRGVQVVPRRVGDKGLEVPSVYTESPPHL